MPDPAPTPDDEQKMPSGPRPLSRRATRIFVIAAVVLAFALAFASVYYLLQVAESSPPGGAPADTTRVDTPAQR